MSPSLARLVFAVGIAGLFYLNRDKSVRTSKALWIPVIWFWILGSRAVSVWLGLGPNDPAGEASSMMEGSPVDALILQLLIAGGLAVLITRGPRCSSLLSANSAIICYFGYCLISAMWSDYPDVSAKRWVKATGDIVMALVVVTDTDPVAALRRLFSRVGFVLVPASTLVLKYYPWMATGYDQWTGVRFNLGITTNKNLLGVTTYILALGACWQVLRLLKESHLPRRFAQLVAQCSLLGFAFWNLSSANSATSQSCLMLAVALMLVTRLKRFRNRPGAVHTLILTLVVVGALIKVTGADKTLILAMGRQPDLTGRADIWPVLIRMAPNALIGSGFETFWLGPRLQQVWNAFPNLYVNEAHNGYIEIYLQLGVIGVTLLGWILIDAYRRSVKLFRSDPDTAGLILGFVLATAMYSYTEAGFRMLFYPWMFLILFIFLATNLSRNYSRSAEQPSRSSRSRSNRFETYTTSS